MVRVILALAAAVLLALAIGATWAHRELSKPLPVSTPTTVEIPAGSALSTVTAGLSERGLLPHPWLLAWHGRLTGTAAKIKAGEYVIRPGTTALGLLEQFVAGEVRLYDFTIIEGWTTAEALAALREHPAVRQTLPAGDTEALLRGLEATEDHPEGLLFPDTYRFPKGTRDVDVLRQAYDLMQQHLQRAWAQRVDGLPLKSPYDALILASIVEKETARDDERRQIAGVFVRRLEKGMRLQTDPTVIYGMGEDFDGNIRRRDLRADTPYNTYTRGGLPPTPIALPGEASLRAAVDPAPGEALFFVATGKPDGSHFFSVTREEHEAAVQRYLATLRQRGTR